MNIKIVFERGNRSPIEGQLGEKKESLIKERRSGKVRYNYTGTYFLLVCAYECERQILK